MTHSLYTRVFEELDSISDMVFEELEEIYDGGEDPNLFIDDIMEEYTLVLDLNCLESEYVYKRMANKYHEELDDMGYIS